MQHAGLQYTDNAPFDSSSSIREVMRFNDSNGEMTLGEIFLNPTRIYCDPVVDLIKSAQSGEMDFQLRTLGEFVTSQAGVYPIC